MAAVVALTVSVIPVCGSTGTVLHFPFQGVSPVMVAPPSVASVPLASPGCPPARVMTSALRNPALGGAIVTAASPAPAPCALLIIVTQSWPAPPMQYAVRLTPPGFLIWTGLTCPAEPRVNALMPYPFGLIVEAPGLAGSGTIVAVASPRRLWKFTPAAPWAANQCR